MKEQKETITLFLNGFLNSYSQIFFSLNKFFAVLLILATFIDYYAGIAGMVAVLVTHLVALVMGFSKKMIRSGLYGFNSLLVGLSMGVYFEFSPEFFLMLFFAVLITLFLTVWLSNLFARLAVPYLSIPFLLAVWTILLATRSYDALALSERGIYTINEIYSYGGQGLLAVYNYLDGISIPLSVEVYLKSLGAIFFQYNLMAGLLIAVGLLMFSRIAFTLSLIGFYAGYLFYFMLKGDFTQLQYSYIGFNFILSAIAVGGFFLIPSWKSYLFVLIITPVIAIVNSATVVVLSAWQLPVYSLPFNLLVILLLYVLKMRLAPRHLDLATVQHYSPETNLYRFQNNRERFKKSSFTLIHLPFYGEWKITQGHEGAITHKEDWRHAWDFEITDNEDKTYKPPGTLPEHFYCYNRPVIAPADGYVVGINDNIEDNEIGKVNLKNNWGNSIVIKHTEKLFTQISHLLKGSFKVKVGDYVKKGDILAKLGNSGRSPEPHLHFQVQQTPYVGSKTMEYPISYFIKYKANNEKEFCSFEIPKENETIANVDISKLMKGAFDLIPGKRLRFMVKEDGKEQEAEWEVKADVLNQTYVHCLKTNATAYFINNGTMLYFTDFKGDRQSLLYYFFIGAYKVLFGFYKDLELKDRLPVDAFYRGPLKWIQDIVAPFFIFLKADYKINYEDIDDEMDSKRITLGAQSRLRTGTDLSFRFELENNRLQRFMVTDGGKQVEAEWIE